MRRAPASWNAFFRHAGIYRSDAVFNTLKGGAGVPPPVGRPRGPAQRRDGRSAPYSSSAMSSGRLFLDRVVRQQSPSPLRRQPDHINTGRIGRKDLSSNGNRVFFSVSPQKGFTPPIVFIRVYSWPRSLCSVRLSALKWSRQGGLCIRSRRGASASRRTSTCQREPSRKIKPGMATLHPRGIRHGPHPRALANQAKKKYTDESAVMLDGLNPIHVLPAGEAVEWKEYWQSWMEKR